MRARSEVDHYCVRVCVCVCVGWWVLLKLGREQYESFWLGPGSENPTTGMEKKSLNTSEDTKFERHLLKANEDIPQKRRRILQTFV